jgi:hypothetical protein
METPRAIRCQGDTGTVFPKICCSGSGYPSLKLRPVTAEVAGSSPVNSGSRFPRRSSLEASVSAEERAVIVALRKELGGNLDLVPEILRHWKRTGEKLNQTDVKDAVKDFSRRRREGLPEPSDLERHQRALGEFQIGFLVTISSRAESYGH